MDCLFESRVSMDDHCALLHMWYKVNGGNSPHSDDHSPATQFELCVDCMCHGLTVVSVHQSISVHV